MRRGGAQHYRRSARLTSACPARHAKGAGQLVFWHSGVAVGRTLGRRRGCRLLLFCLHLGRILHHALHRRLHIGVQAAHQLRKPLRLGMLDGVQRLCGGRQRGGWAQLCVWASAVWLQQPSGSVGSKASHAPQYTTPHHTTPRHATPHHARPPSQPKPAQASLSLARLTRKEDEGVDCVDGALHLLILVLRPVLVICRRKHTHPCNPDSAKGRGVRSGGRCLGAGVRGSSTATRLVLDRHMRRGRAQAAQKAAATPPALPAFRLPSQHPALHVI